MRGRLNGEDVGVFIISENIERRHLTKSQSAMTMAMTHPEPKRGPFRVEKFNWGFGLRQGEPVGPNVHL